MTFYNILSNKKQKPENKTPIIIDTREKQSLVAAHLTNQNASVNFETLEIGDYLINDICIERKTFSDFVSSMINKRLHDQLREIKKYPKHFLIIEGLQEIENKNLEKAAKGMILSTIIDYQVPILFTQDDVDTADLLLRLAKQQSKPKAEFSLRAKTPMTTEQQKQFILEGFEGIGPTTAKKLLEKYKTLKKVFQVSLEELEKDIGKKSECFKILDE